MTFDIPCYKHFKTGLTHEMNLGCCFMLHLAKNDLSRETYTCDSKHDFTPCLYHDYGASDGYTLYIPANLSFSS